MEEEEDVDYEEEYDKGEIRRLSGEGKGRGNGEAEWKDI